MPGEYKLTLACYGSHSPKLCAFAPLRETTRFRFANFAFFAANSPIRKNVKGLS